MSEAFPSFEETATREILPRLLVVFNDIDEEDGCQTIIEWFHLCVVI